MKRDKPIIKELKVHPCANGKMIEAVCYIDPEGEESVVVFINGLAAGAILMDDIGKIMEEARIEF